MAAALLPMNTHCLSVCLYAAQKTVTASSGNVKNYSACFHSSRDTHQGECYVGCFTGKDPQ